MRLISFRVERFRNVLDSGEVAVDENVTCLVGKNESGKSNILHALHALNPAYNDRSFDEQQYPRWLQKEHQRSGEFESARPISVTFELTDDELAAVNSMFGEGVLTEKMWTLAKNYSNAHVYNIKTSEEAACTAFEAKHGTSTGATKVPALKAALEKRGQETAANAEGAQVPTAEAQKAQKDKVALDAQYPDTVVASVYKQLVSLMPRFFYFSEYSQLDGRTEIAPLIEALRTDAVGSLNDSQRTALALLRLGFAGENLVNPDYEKRSGEMEAVAADLTRQVRKYWHQNNHLRLIIDIESKEETREDGTHLVDQFLQLRVEDDRHFFTNNLDVRSSGFRWFVSFLSAFKEFESDKSVIVLLDEPALALHARAQRDFLDFIDDTVAGTHQVVYTTHSPFMVDAAHLERVRVVEDMGPEEGAKVKAQLMSRDPDTLSPLQGALGYDIAQNIFVGPDNLVVEGLSDYTYLTVISEALREAGRDHLDMRWRILPAGGAGTMPAAVSLLGQELDVTVVVDGGSNPPRKLTNLVDEGILEGSRIIMLGQILGAPPKTADIEDVFTPEDYLALFNGALGKALKVTDLDPGDDRIIGKINRADAEFNHNDPSNWFLANRATAVSALSGDSLDRFEKVIRAINATLKQ